MDKVKFSSDAQKEMERSLEWYDDQSFGLAERFADAISNSIRKILKNPSSYPKKPGNSREFQVNKFPFIIIYRYNESTGFLKILHVFHTKRNPKYKYRNK